MARCKQKATYDVPAEINVFLENIHVCETFFSVKMCKTSTEYLICCQLINSIIKHHNLKRQEPQHYCAFHTRCSTSADCYTHRVHLTKENIISLPVYYLSICFYGPIAPAVYNRINLIWFRCKVETCSRDSHLSGFSLPSMQSDSPFQGTHHTISGNHLQGGEWTPSLPTSRDQELCCGHLHPDKTLLSGGCRGRAGSGLLGQACSRQQLFGSFAICSWTGVLSKPQAPR